MRKYLVLLTIFTYGLLGADGQTMPSVDKSRLPKATTAKSLAYWFDDKSASMTTVTTLSGKLTIDGSALNEGLHTLHYQLTGSNGEASSVGSSLFFRSNPNPDMSAKTLRYWFDANADAPGTISAANSTTTLDVSSLRDGLHTFHCQVIAADRQPYTIGSTLFMKVSNTAEVLNASKLSYWFDSESSRKQTDMATSLQTIDASALRSGLHTLHYQIVNGLGMETPPASALFLKLDNTAVAEAKTVSYWFDQDHASAKQIAVSNLMKVVDAKDMPEGPHTLHYQLQAADGTVFPICSAAFERWFFDIYIKESTEYNADTIAKDPTFARNPWLKMDYSANDLAIRGRLTVDDGATLSLGKYVQTGNLGNYSGYDYRFNHRGPEYYHPTTLINQGYMRADSVKVTENFYHNRWHFIALPFNVAVDSINMPENTYWALRRYSGEARAAGEKSATWQNLKAGDTMKAGQGYILQLTRDNTKEQTTSLTFKAENDTRKNDIFVSGDAEVALTEYQSEFAHNRSWNLVGNPYPSFFDTRFIEQGGTITVWNGNGYSAYSLNDDNYVLMPFEAFFMQKPLNESTVTFSAEGRQHTHELRQIAPTRMRRAALKGDRRIVNISVGDGTYTDRTRLVINELAAAGYEDDKDAAKFFVGQDGDDSKLPPTVQLYSVETSVKYAINERPMGDGYATLSLMAPADGDYTLQVDGNAELTQKLAILDTTTGLTWTAAEGPLTFSATAGRHDARFIVALNGSTTGIGQQCLSDDGEMSVADGQLTFRLARESSVRVFAADGRLVYSMQGTNGSVTLQSGIYLIHVGNKTTKIIVK